MGATLRAVRALVLLAGFYLLGFVMLGALVAADWAAAQTSVGSAYVKIWILSALLAIPIVQGMFALRTPKAEPLAGLPVTEQQEPALWAAVRALAEQTGTRAPDEILLTGDVNAAVSEDATFLGLKAGRRRMYIGLPLMTGLSEPQLQAVLAHEFGHYTHHDTRLSAITLRGRHQVMRTVAALHERSRKKIAKEQARQEKKNAKRVARGKEAAEVGTGVAGLSYRLAAKPFLWYGIFYLRASQGVGRQQELAADLAAARIVGRNATASALREIPVLDAAHDFYMRSYATLGTGAGLLPPPGEVFGGLRHLLAGRAAELDEMRRSTPDEELSPYDSHPPIAERVARIEQLPHDGRTLAGARPALALLSDPARAFVELEHATLTPEARQLRRAADWPWLVHESMLWHADQDAEPLRRAIADVHGGDGSLASFLAAVEAGRLWQVADRLPKSEEAGAATGRAAREFVRPQLRARLSRLVAVELVRLGWAHWELSWTDSAKLRLPDGYEEWLKSALDAAVADVPDTRELRRLLTPAG
ncbi:M48 family metalloprotease [Streptomyces jeddahensis]|uniref:Protease HtpX n=1 Tax=Streptomyces jeddahensis TaxID=1716141 RepID=A0A177HSK6_9ACTN|nr:M48 family metallopeptidase [Streptomyces jeddahensis]OAH13865.1 protease HtpX [Streptomyces jeddahensis]